MNNDNASQYSPLPLLVLCYDDDYDGEEDDDVGGGGGWKYNGW